MHISSHALLWISHSLDLHPYTILISISNILLIYIPFSQVFDSVEMTRYLPKELAQTGRIDSSKKALNQLIGELFVEQTEVNLFSSILG